MSTHIRVGIIMANKNMTSRDYIINKRWDDITPEDIKSYLFPNETIHGYTKVEECKGVPEAELYKVEDLLTFKITNHETYYRVDEYDYIDLYEKPILCSHYPTTTSLSISQARILLYKNLKRYLYNKIQGLQKIMNAYYKIFNSIPDTLEDNFDEV